MAPGELLAKHTSLELTEWQAYFKLEAVEQERSKDKVGLQQENSRGRGRRREVKRE